MSPIDSFGRAQTVLLIGGDSDIGRAIVARMVDNGARKVILAGRDTASPAPNLDADVDRRHFDALRTGSHRGFFDAVFSDHPDIDVVVFAAGILHDQEKTEENPDLAAEMANVNYVGTASSLLHAAQHLRGRGHGQLVVLSSVAGIRPRRSNFVYGSSKAAIDFLARGLARHVEESNVHVLIVRPGFVHTSMTRGIKSRPFAVSAEAVAKSVVDGLAREDHVVWVPEILRWVMGIVRVLPARLVDRLDR